MRSLRKLAEGLGSVECALDGVISLFDDVTAVAVDALRATRLAGGTCWVFGNGGLGSVADHIACDMVLAGFRAYALTNPALTTTMANDHGFINVFSRQLQALMREGDMLIGMSCSGESENVVLAMANTPRAFRIGLSGFRRDNWLRRIPLDVSFWVESDDYATVQIVHLAVLHLIVDLAKEQGR